MLRRAALNVRAHDADLRRVVENLRLLANVGRQGRTLAGPGALAGQAALVEAVFGLAHEVLLQSVDAVSSS